MVDFLRKVDIEVSVMEFVLKPEDTMILLFQTVKMSSSIVKAEEISDISNALIINHETAKLLENKPKKTLEEMSSLDRL
ncbi:8039_t:CDS:2 [Funneliformis geosporum]|uniref:8039_t:CDS:1 n=1 Tax=Funneliformis geosporum TaxID=1117311 RepID=A0A9W4X2R2_9GLOM|nr:8039_t:CDS:2 [Funneliformis geosporum]